MAKQGGGGKKKKRKRAGKKKRRRHELMACGVMFPKEGEKKFRRKGGIGGEKLSTPILSATGEKEKEGRELGRGGG